jgi:hypothetical protein
MAKKQQSGLNMGGGLAGYADRQRKNAPEQKLFATIEDVNPQLKGGNKKRGR